MKLPETHNANNLYAFKKGYRLAMEGRPLSQMPSQIKLDGTMREYFEQGWHQYQDDLAEATENDSDSPWRNKVIWTLMAVFAGLATASLMVHNIQQEKQTSSQHSQALPTPQPTKVNVPTPSKDESSKEETEDFSLISSAKPGNDPQTPKASQEQNKDVKQTANPSSTVSKNAPDQQETLGLLSKNERTDLAAAKHTFEQDQSKDKLLPLVKTSIYITRAQLTDSISHKEPGHIFTDTVPKYARKVYFFTQIRNAKGQTLYHRWRYNGKIMASIPLKVTSNHFRTWSSKRLSSAWSGNWSIEILNQKKQPIYRLDFKYAQ